MGPPAADSPSYVWRESTIPTKFCRGTGLGAIHGNLSTLFELAVPRSIPQEGRLGHGCASETKATGPQAFADSGGGGKAALWTTCRVNCRRLINAARNADRSRFAARRTVPL